MKPTIVADWTTLADREPAGALIANVDLVIVRYDDEVSVFYGRCQHRGALLADGHISGNNLICGLHFWDYDYRSGVSAYNNAEHIHRFTAWVEDDSVLVDEDEVAAWADENPQPYDREAYLGTYADVHGTPDEPYVGVIKNLAQGLGDDHDGPLAAMGVPRDQLPHWEDIQFVTAQVARRPLLEDVEVATTTVIGPRADKPLELAIPILVTDMSFGALSAEAKVALAKGAEAAGTGICSGEGGMLPEEVAANSRYFYELASGGFGWDISHVTKVGAFHFKFGQGAKTGTGGHLPGSKVQGRIAEVRHLKPGTPAISPATFPDLITTGDFQRVADQVRETSGGVPIGAKMSAQHIEADIEAALAIGVDYIILDGRGGGTGAAPTLFRDNISVPTIPALARARRYLDRHNPEITLIVTGGLRTPADFAKALALGADAIAVANSAMQAIGCLGMRACQTNNCPVGIATQQHHLRDRLDIDKSADQLTGFLHSSTELMAVLARACGHNNLAQFNVDDLTTFNRDLYHLAAIPYGGINP